MALTPEELEAIRKRTAARQPLVTVSPESTDVSTGLTDTELAGIRGRVQERGSVDLKVETPEVAPKPDHIIPIPGMQISIPSKHVPEAMRPYMPKQPTMGQVARGSAKFFPELLETLGSIGSTGYGLLTDPEKQEEALGMAGVVGRGIRDIAGRQMTPGLIQADSPEAAAVRSIPGTVAEEFGKFYQDPGGYWEQSPVGALGMLSVGTGAMGKAGNLVDPLALLARVSGQGLRFVGRKIVRGRLERAAVTAGVGEEALEIAHRIGLEEGFGGGPRTEIFSEAQAGVRTAQGVAMRTVEALPELYEFAATRLLDDIAKINAANPGLKVDARAMRKSISKELNGSGIDISLDDVGNVVLTPRNNTTAMGLIGELGPIEEMLNLISNWTDDSLEGMWTLRKTIDKHRNKAGDFSNKTELNKLMVNARNKIREAMHKAAPGDPDAGVPAFSKIDNDWEEFTHAMDIFKNALGIDASDAGKIARVDVTELPALNQNVFTKLGNLLNRRTSGNLENSKAAFREIDKVLEKQTGVKGSLEAELAGVRLSKEASRGITGAVRGGTAGTMSGSGLLAANLAALLGGGVTGAVAAGFTASGLAYVYRTLRGLTVENPRSVGAAFRALGAKEHLVEELVDFATRALNHPAGQGVRRGAALGVVIDRIENSNRAGGFLDDIGSISRTPSTLTVP